jgi:hypothetical protein
MMAAYKLPPMFPDQLGDRARPFFGLNMTTFMWLLRMVSGSGMGGMGGMLIIYLLSIYYLFILLSNHLCNVYL